VQRGRPRSAEADRAILAATVDLLAERGLAAMSIEEVAARAGVGKTTIYRRWPSKGLLALDAFVISFRAEQPQPDTGTLRGDLLAALHAWVRAVTQTAMGPMLTGLIAEAQHDPELRGAWRDRVLEPLRTQHRMMLDRAIERGEIPASVDRDVVLDLFFGAAEHRLLLGHLPMTGDFIAEVVDVILSGIVGSPLRHPGRSVRPPGARAQRGLLSGRIVATGRVRGSMVHKSLPEARNLPDAWDGRG
jgi:AcrR family transcriptional regulator